MFPVNSKTFIVSWNVGGHEISLDNPETLVNGGPNNEYLTVAPQKTMQYLANNKQQLALQKDEFPGCVCWLNRGPDKEGSTVRDIICNTLCP